MSRKTYTKQVKQISKILFRTMPMEFKNNSLKQKTGEFLTLELATEKHSKVFLGSSSSKIHLYLLTSGYPNLPKRLGNITLYLFSFIFLFKIY